jgi:hypothetical protein
VRTASASSCAANNSVIFMVFTSGIYRHRFAEQGAATEDRPYISEQVESETAIPRQWRL